MMTDIDFSVWCKALDLSPAAKALIHTIRTSEPVRRVSGGAHNVCVYYPSQKMGRTIQAESHTNEFHWVLHYELNEDVLEYWCQPSVLDLKYAGPTGKRTIARHTPDYFVMRRKSAGWEECKLEDRLKQLAIKSPNRYKSIDGIWRCPPGEAYAEFLGLYYRLVSSASISVNFVRNATWLEDFFRDKEPLSSDVVATVKLYLEKHPSTTLEDLFNAVVR